ncbi:MAG: carboxypeptidase-like regulatory domain-containing protein [Bacteroidales bacterium]|nr:carboxypeptidase-like regulatory domain-containing protein [Bacteroidales bacterium]
MKNRNLLELDAIQKAVFYRIISVSLLFLFLGNSINQACAQESVLDQKISIKDQKNTIYNLLGQITDVTGCFFIYDSRLVDNDKVITLRADNKPLKQVIYEILDDNTLDFKVIEKHILIYKKGGQKIETVSVKKDSTMFISINGQILDKTTKKPLPFVAVGISEKSIGTVSNYDGFFTLRIPSYLKNVSLTISHLGYKSQNIPISLLIEHKVDIYLETEYISIQEVIIRNIDSRDIVYKAFRNRSLNYTNEPVYITSFYREGVLKNGKYLNYSEAVMNIYKSPYFRIFESDQVKLLKSRKIVNIDQNDTLVLKIKAGIRSCLTLDLVKNIPDFIDPDYMDSYNYSKEDIVSLDSRNVYVIAFEQKENVTEPLFKGNLYIDVENFAILKADFEVNPRYLKNADDLFIVKKSRKFNVTPEKIFYTIYYSFWNGKYYINHIRGDLSIRYKKRYHLFSNDFQVFLELASCQIDTFNVVKFNRDEIFKTSAILVDSKFSFDESFWGNYNIITPEEKINQALSRIKTKTEFVKPE